MRTVEVLGPVRVVEGDGTVVELGSPTQRLLLALLAAARPRSVTTSALIDAVWPDGAPPSARNSLGSHLSRLRRRLGHGAITRVGDGYRLDLATDADDLAERSGDQDPEVLLDTLARWRADPTDDWGSNPTLRGRAAELAELRATVRHRRAERLAAGGRVDEAIAELRRLTADRPGHERAWTDLVALTATSGRRTEALRTAQAARLALAEVGLDDHEALRAAEQLALHGTRRPVPRPQSPLIGRAEELERLTAVLGETRWTTVVGPGGVGKSRLAADAAAGAQDAGAEVVIVDLSAVAHDADLAAAVAREVGGPILPDPLDRLVQGIGDRDLLLVLDACEHRLDAVRNLAAAVTGLGRLRVLATSRRPIDRPDERLVELGPLSVDAARELFTRSAARLGEPAGGDELVDAVCERVDRLPLGVEIAAAQLRLMDPAELADRLARPGRALDGATTDRRSLRTTIDDSVDLLDQDAAVVLARLSSFVGPFTIDRAEEVAGWGSLRPAEVPPIVAALRDASLLSPVQAGRGRRLRLLDTVRAHAADLLVLAGEDDDQAERHGDVYARLASLIEAGITGPDEGRWAAVAETELGDLGAAVRRALGRDDPRTATSITTSLFQYAYDRVRPEIGAWADDILRHGIEEPARRDLVVVASLGAFQIGELDRAAALAATATGDDRTADRARIVAANVHLVRGEPSAARLLARRVAEDPDSETYLRSLAALLAAVAARYEGDDTHAMAAVELAEELAAAPDAAPTMRAYAAYASGEVLAERDPAEALRRLDDAVDIARDVGSAVCEGVARVTLGTLAATSGDPIEAVASFRSTMALWRDHPDRHRSWITIRNLVVALARAGEVEEAAVLLGAVDAQAPEPYGSEAERLAGTRAELADLLGPQHLEALTARGRALRDDEVVALALGHRP